ncbi:MAG: hypothetical protein RL172_2987 [Bacteroidota bacterium]|jgi:predicted dehydrogenase
MINVIIGAGELGSRHLQGLLKYQQAQHIYVVDPSEASLALATTRAAEIPHQHLVEYCTDISQVPANLDLVIIATTSAVREAVINHLLPGRVIKYLLLEKVLFQQLSSYSRMQTLFSSQGIPVWVNHPRRMYQHYARLAGQVAADNAVVNMNVSGGNWGLGCNALHMIDLAVYINGSPLQHIHTTGLDKQVIEGKRKGYQEFTGTITGTLQNGAFFSITSFAGNRGAITVHFASDNNRWLVQEGGTPCLLTLAAADKYQVQQTPLNSFFQSELTAAVAAQLNETGTCTLPTYADAANTHKIFIASLLQQYQILTGINTDICPIT